MINQLPLSADTIIISVNPKAGRTSPMARASELESLLKKKGFKAEILTDLSLVAQRANRLFEESKLRVLIGVGGDGTAAELVNRTLPGLPVSLLPAGTANLISKYLHLPFKPQKTADMIEQGWIDTFDAGRANGRLFLVMVSAGIDADIVRKVHQAREESYKKGTKKGAHISYFSYMRPIFSSIFSYKFPKIDVTIGDTGDDTNDDMNDDTKSSSSVIAPVTVPNEQVVSGKWTFIFNLPEYGWGLPLVPHCIGYDRRLDYCIFKRGTFLCSVINVFFAQMGSFHRFLPNSRLGRGTRFTLSCDQEVPYQLDGDPGGVLPVQIETIPHRFTILAPKHMLLKRGETSHAE